MRLSAHVVKLLIPHHTNNHHAWLIRHQGILVVFSFLLIFQIFTNVVIKKEGKVLGFATDVSVSSIVDLTNKERSKVGAGSLQENSLLSKAAFLKASDMFSKDYWAHSSPDGLDPWYFFKKVGYSYSFAGENLAKDFYTSDSVVAAWIDSPSHRDNLLNSSYKEIGIAVVNGELKGEDTTLIVQLFGTQPAGLSTQTVTPTNNASQKAETAQLKPNISEIEKPTGMVLAPNTSIKSSPTLLLKADSLSFSQKIFIITLAVLIFAFLVDSLYVFKFRLDHRKNSHSFLHALVLIVVLGFIVLSSRGVIY